MTTTTTNSFLVVLMMRNELNEVKPARRRFTDEADAEQFANALLGADAPDGIIYHASLFRENADKSLSLLNEWEY